MKLIAILLLALSFLGCGDDDIFQANCLPNNLQNGVIAFYPFMNGALTDNSTNSNNLSNSTSASPTTDRFGNQDCAYIFNNNQGNTEFLTTTNTNFLNSLPQFSIAAWYQPIDSTRSGGDYEVLISRGDTPHCPDRRGEWSLGLYDCRRAVFGHNNSVWAYLVTNPFVSCEAEVNVLTGKWHQVVATKNNDDYKIYFDGILNETAIGDASCGTNYLAQDIGDMFIGNHYRGKIDDVIIYNREISQQEVTALYNLDPCCQ